MKTIKILAIFAVCAITVLTGCKSEDKLPNAILATPARLDFEANDLVGKYITVEALETEGFKYTVNADWITVTPVEDTNTFHISAALNVGETAREGEIVFTHKAKGYSLTVPVTQKLYTGDVIEFELYPTTSYAWSDGYFQTEFTTQDMSAVMYLNGYTAGDQSVDEFTLEEGVYAVDVYMDPFNLEVGMRDIVGTPYGSFMAFFDTETFIPYASMMITDGKMVVEQTDDTGTFMNYRIIADFGGQYLEGSGRFTSYKTVRVIFTGFINFVEKVEEGGDDDH